jgi:hypothetical protein
MTAPTQLPVSGIPRISASFHRWGYQIIPDVLSADDSTRLTDAISGSYDAERRRSRTRIGGLRNLLQHPHVRGIARSERILALLMQADQCPVFPVRALFFDKTAEANWAVPWHQDLSIAVAQRLELDGFEGWSVKDGVMHVQPPVGILSNMITLRIHLDACSAANGALKVIPGSHLGGRLSDAETESWLKRAPVTCEVPRGGALLMRPLLLHASAPAAAPTHRRVLHLEYASGPLPGGLEWHESAVD